MGAQTLQALSVILPAALGVDAMPTGNGPGLQNPAQSGWVNVNGWTYFSLTVNVQNNGANRLFVGMRVKVAGRTNPATAHLGAGNAEVNAHVARIGDFNAWFCGPAFSLLPVVGATFRPFTVIWGRNAGDMSNVRLHGGDSELLKSCNFRECLFQVWPIFNGSGALLNDSALITLQLEGG
jgi:hypothetical protein